MDNALCVRMARGRVFEREALGMVARLRPLDLDAVFVKCLAFDDGEAVVVAKVEVLRVLARRVFDGHAALARLDRAVERLLDVFVDGVFGDGAREAGHEVGAEEILVEDQRAAA